MDSKQEKLIRVASATLNIIDQHGIRELNPTRVARAAKVSRAWVYKYVGGGKDQLMECAADYFGTLYSRLDVMLREGQFEDWVQDELDAFENSLELVKQYPWILRIYFRYKGTQTSIGNSIEKVEKIYVTRKVGQLCASAGAKPENAIVWVELLLSFKLALVHRCQYHNLQSKIGKEALESKLRRIFTVLGEISRASA